MKSVKYLLHGLILFLSLSPIMVQAQADTTEAPQLSDWGPAVSDIDLAERRGRNIYELNTNNLDGRLFSNSAMSNITGGNIVTNGAFTNSSGFSTIIQNSGNNVLIQNATILNLKLQ